MILFKHIKHIRLHIGQGRQSGKKIGFVPTMGALHQGHISLIQQAKKQCDMVVCSVFVNPTQFNDPKDFDKYPQTIEQDIDMLEQAGCDVLFLPSVSEMYPDTTAIARQYPLGYLETVLDGAFRPGHFQGVCQVVEKLLTIIQPHQLFLGQKDYQQCMVIKKLLELMGSPTQLIICPTQRESDGLAMSSRNLRLSVEERKIAPQIFQTLLFLQQNILPGDISQLTQAAINQLTAMGFTVDYIEIANADSLALLQHWDGKTPIVALIAAFNGEVRLIDNLVLN